MKKIKLNCAATMEETFADFLTSRKAKGLADKTLQSYEQQFRAVARRSKNLYPPVPPHIRPKVSD